jgi:hypothetical protein
MWHPSESEVEPGQKVIGVATAGEGFVAYGEGIGEGRVRRRVPFVLWSTDGTSWAPETDTQISSVDLWALGSNVASD